MLASITLNFTNDPASLAEAADLVAALRSAVGAKSAQMPTQVAPAAAPIPASQPAAPAGKPEDHVEKWLKRLGKGSRRFWKLVAQFASKKETLLITFEDLARETKLSAASLRSYHRNSYRAINDEKATDPMPGAWSGATKRYEYAMSQAVRDKILELTKDDAA